MWRVSIIEIPSVMIKPHCCLHKGYLFVVLVNIDKSFQTIWANYCDFNFEDLWYIFTLQNFQGALLYNNLKISDIFYFVSFRWQFKVFCVKFDKPVG